MDMKTHNTLLFICAAGLTIAGLIFLAASYPTSILVRKLENRLARY